MPDKKEIRCQKCGEPIPVEPGMAEGFCLHCGEKFTIKKEKTGKPLLAHAVTLYDNEDWAALLDYTGENGGDALRLLAVLARLHTLHENYERDAAELAANTAVKGFLKFFTGRNAYGEDPMHRAFYDADQEQVEAMTALLEKGAADAALRGRVVQDAADLLLGVDKKVEQPTYWSLVAAEQHVLPLLPYLDAAPLVALYVAYKGANPDNQSLPNQMQIKKEMERCIREKGEEVPKVKKQRSKKK